MAIMPRHIDKDSDDKSARIRFHISSARMSIDKMSFVAFQRFLDDMERSMYLCPDCGWRGRGRDLIPMEQDSLDVYTLQEAESWYACPHCEQEIAVEHPIMKSAG
jgi:predicted RNA-binding Zn-ribbon protein involved in translation (DUF1610 family)